MKIFSVLMHAQSVLGVLGTLMSVEVHENNKSNTYQSSPY